MADLPKLLSLLNDELGGEAASAKLASLGAIKQQAQQLISASVIRPLYNQVVSAAETLAQELRGAAQKVSVDLLMKARAYVATEKPNICPVCEQNIEAENLLARLDHRINENASLRQASDTLDDRLKKLIKAAEKAHAAYTSFDTAWGSLGIALSCIAFAR